VVDQGIRSVGPWSTTGRAAVVRFLLEHGAGVVAMGDTGKALLNAAVKAEPNGGEITELLRAAMSKDSGTQPLAR